MSLNVAKAAGNEYILTREVLVALLVLIVSVGKCRFVKMFILEKLVFNNPCCFTVLFVLWKKSRKTNHDVLFVGLCDSGKTALFSYLLYNKPIQSFTSQVENLGDFKSKKVYSLCYVK